MYLQFLDILECALQSAKGYKEEVSFNFINFIFCWINK